MLTSGDAMQRIAGLVKDFGWLGTVAVAVITGVWAVTTYLENAKRDYVKDFNTKQIQTFFLTAETVSNLVAEQDQAKWTAYTAQFWALHYGDLVIFENPRVECAMTYFGAKLAETKFERRRELGPYAYAVSHELRDFIKYLNKKEWRINLATLTGAGTDVTPTLDLKSGQQARSEIDKKCRPLMQPPGAK